MAWVEPSPQEQAARRELDRQIREQVVALQQAADAAGVERRIFYPVVTSEDQ